MIRRQVSLSSLTSWQVGGPADYLAEPRSERELEAVLCFASEQGLEMTILGGGTNVLISDQGIRGLVIALHKFNQCVVRESNGVISIEAFAGLSKSELLKIFLKAKLAPALFLAGLPGDIGGGVAMNAGVGEMIRPREFVELTKAIEVWRLPDRSSLDVDRVQRLDRVERVERVILQKNDLQWSYRHCEGWRPGLIAKVWLEWPLEPEPSILERVREANRIRLQKQPLDRPSCGSVFVNPPGEKAGQLIERAGLKGFAIGGAQVSEKHANFIVNRGGAAASDIAKVINHVRETVLQRTGIQLKTEVVLLGEWGEATAPRC